MLLIEDEDRSVRQTMESLHQVFGDVAVTVVGSLAEALRAIETQFFDLAICDIQIRSDDSSLDASEQHGIAAYEALHLQSPGTPVVFLSAHASIDNTSSRTASGGVADVMGVPAFPLTQVVVKGDPAKIEAYFLRIREGLADLALCTVSEAADALEEMFVRAVQVYGRSIGSTSAEVTPMDGLSKARVGLVRFKQDCNPDAVVVLKLDTQERIRNEVALYSRYVANRLTVGCFAPQIRTLDSGLRGMAAVVSSLASPSSRSLFSRMEASPPPVSIAAVRSALSGWTTEVDRITTTIGDYRRGLIDDEVFADLPTFRSELTDLDDVQVEISRKLCHGDFHGENVLVDDDGRIVVIDFADCGVLPSSLDAAALELSLIAHPKSPIEHRWPGVDCSAWADADSFSRDGPWSTEIRALRDWAIAESSEIQAFVVYYGQACWLMKHNDPGAVRASQVAVAALRRIRALLA
ncbi:phosphotransferase [Microbacterium sp. NPDC091313]